MQIWLNGSGYKEDLHQMHVWLALEWTVLAINYEQPYLFDEE